jgi:hypothetical protein
MDPRLLDALLVNGAFVEVKYHVMRPTHTTE